MLVQESTQQSLLDEPFMVGSDDDLPALDPITADDINLFDPLAAGDALADNSVVLELHFRSPGWSRSINPKAIMATDVPDDQKINPARVRASKDLIDRKEFKEFKRFVSKTMAKIKNQRCLASNFLAAGMYVLPLNCVNDVDKIIGELDAGITYHLDKIEPRWSSIVEKAQKDLGPQFNINDYPPFAQVRENYGLTARYLSFNVPKALAGINKAIYEKALEKSNTDRAEMAKVIRDGMRGGFLSLVTHFAERMGRDSEGKLKTFHASTAEKLQDFLDMFQNRAIVGDSDLAVLAQKAKDLISGVDPKALRSDEALREALEKGFNEIKEAASAMIVPQERALALDQEI